MDNQELRQATIDAKHRTDIFFVLYAADRILRREVWENGYGNVLKDTRIVARGNKTESFLEANEITEVITKS